MMVCILQAIVPAGPPKACQLQSDENAAGPTMAMIGQREDLLQTGITVICPWMALPVVAAPLDPTDLPMLVTGGLCHPVDEHQIVDDMLADSPCLRLWSISDKIFSCFLFSTSY